MEYVLSIQWVNIPEYTMHDIDAKEIPEGNAAVYGDNRRNKKQR